MKLSADDLRTRLEGWVGGFKDRGASVDIGLDITAFLLGLRLAHERTQPPYSEPPYAPSGSGWESLEGLGGGDLVDAIRSAADACRGTETTLGLLAGLTAIPDEPALLGALMSAIARPEDHVGAAAWWYRTDLLCDAWDALLVSLGQGQEIELLPTHRDLVTVLAGGLEPMVSEELWDPATGSGRMLIDLHGAARRGADGRTQLQALKLRSCSGIELRPGSARWAAMNLLLHGIGALGSTPQVVVGDSLASPAPAQADVVLTNPTFGRAEESLMSDLAEGSRIDIAVTGQRHLDMLQHVMSLLRPGGRAAIILPDNVLFEGGVGEAVRRRLLYTCDVHTVLRLPTGISAKSGVKANVLFFTKQPAREEPWTTETWYYDLRTNTHFTLKKQPMKRDDLQPFVDAYCVGDRNQREASERFRCFTYDELVDRDQVNLDITWLKDDSHIDVDDLPDPDVLAAEIAEELYAAATVFEQLAVDLDAAES